MSQRTGEVLNVDVIVELVLDKNSSEVEVPDVNDPNNLDPEKINSKNAFDQIFSH